MMSCYEAATLARSLARMRASCDRAGLDGMQHAIEK
jgi:hypothetical protein